MLLGVLHRALALCLIASTITSLELSSLRSLDSLNPDADWPNDVNRKEYPTRTKRNDVISHNAKRHPTYSKRVCPTDMRHIDCFYAYLDIYVQIKDRMKSNNANIGGHTRNIGKRNSRLFDALSPDVCKGITSIELCLIVLQDKLNGGDER